jgi:hypothetical protein
MSSAVERGRSGPHRVRPPRGGVRRWRSNSGHVRPALIPVLSCGDHDTRERSPCRALHSLKSELRSHMQAMRVPPCPARRKRPRVPDIEICRREHTGLAGHATLPGSDHPPAAKERSPQTAAERSRATDREHVVPAMLPHLFGDGAGKGHRLHTQIPDGFALTLVTESANLTSGYSMLSPAWTGLEFHLQHAGLQPPPNGSRRYVERLCHFGNGHPLARCHRCLICISPRSRTSHLAVIPPASFAAASIGTALNSSNSPGKCRREVGPGHVHVA